MDEKAPTVEDTEKRLKAAVLHSLVEEAEGLKKCEEELKVRRMRVERLTKLSADWEFEERTKWKGEVPALPTPKVRSGVKRKKNPRPGKLKRLRMRSSKESVAESNAEEPVDLPPSQPSPGPSRDRSGFGESVSGPQQEDGCSEEEVVMLDEESEVFLEAEEERTEKIVSPKRMSEALRFSRRVVERTPTYDELIEGTTRGAFFEETDLELDVPWEDRMF